MLFWINEGEKYGSSFSFPNSSEGYESLLARFKERDLSSQNILIGMEASGNYWESLYSFLTNRKFQVKVLNPYQVDKYRKLVQKKAKTDDIDVYMIAGLLRSKEHTANFVPEETVQALRELVKLRFEMLKDLKSYKRRV